jgi:hypothetical protein
VSQDHVSKMALAIMITDCAGLRAIYAAFNRAIRAGTGGCE